MLESVQVFATKWFARFARREGIPPESLIEAIERAEKGSVDADLGGGVIKQRVARRGEGRSGGYRTIIAYRTARRAIFLFGFAKSNRENIEADDDDLEAEYIRIAERAKEKIANVRKAYERNDAVAGLRAEIRKRKALDWLTEHVEIVDPEGQTIERAELTPELDPPDVDNVDADAAEEAAQ